MTTDQAKFILQAYRPDQEAANLPELKEALNLMEENESLQKWFEEEQAFDNAFAQKLSNIDIPKGLSELVLTQVIAKPGKPIEFPWWKQFSAWGAAASILLVLGLVLIPDRRVPLQESMMTIENFQQFANQALKNVEGFGASSNDWGKLVEYLNENNTPAPTTLPGSMDQMPTVGCMTLKFKEKPVGVICFGKNSKSHLFVIRSQDFPLLPTTEQPIFEENPFTTTGYWSGKDKHYLVVSQDPQDLRQFVSF
jgi:hypothetical protein